MTEPLFAKLRTLLEEERYTELPLYLLPPSLILFLESKDNLFAALDLMEEALEFYADSDKYLDHDPYLKPGKVGYSETFRPDISDDCGNIAEEALAKVREMGK